MGRIKESLLIHQLLVGAIELGTVNFALPIMEACNFTKPQGKVGKTGVPSVVSALDWRSHDPRGEKASGLLPGWANIRKGDAS